jgi:hypothetical protein
MAGPQTEEFVPPQEAAADARKKFVDGYKERIAISIKENWDGELTGKKNPSNQDIQQWTQDLITKREFSYTDDAGKEQIVRMQDLQSGIDGSPATQQKLKNQFGTTQLSSIILTKKQLDGVADEVEEATEKNRGGISFLGGATIMNAIIGFFQWLSGDKSLSITDTIKQVSVNSATASIENGLANVPGLDQGMQQVLVNNIKTAAEQSSGLAEALPVRTLADVAIGSALPQQVASRIQENNYTPSANETPALNMSAPTASPSVAAPAGQVTVAPTTSNTATLREREMIAGTLTAVSLIDFSEPVPSSVVGKKDRALTASDAYVLGKQGLVSFYNDATQQYEPLKAGTPEALTDAINADQSRRVKITVDGKDRYFEQIAASDRENSPTGFAAAAYREVSADGKPVYEQKNGAQKTEVWMAFPGYTGEISRFGISDGTPQSQALEQMTIGNMNPQAPEAAKFTDSVINNPKVGGKDQLSDIIYGAHSAGSTNAIVARATAELQGVQTDTMVEIEQAGATMIARRTAEDIRNPESPLARQLAALGRPEITPEKLAAYRPDFDKDTVSLRAVFEEKGQLRGTDIASLVPARPEEKVDPAVGIITGIQRFRNGEGNPNIDNGSLGQETYIDVGAQGLKDAKFDGHKLQSMLIALKKGDALVDVKRQGQKLVANNTSMANSGQTAGPQGSKANVVVAQAETTQPTGRGSGG